MQELENAIRDKDVTLYDYKENRLPDILVNKRNASARVFTRKPVGSRQYKTETYGELRHISETAGEVCFLDGESVKVLVAGLPKQSKYVLIRLRLRKSWLFGIPGLVRRIVGGHLKMRGIVRFGVNRRSQRWLVLEKMFVGSAMRNQATLSAEVGVKGLLDYLRKKSVNYVILRFFDELPDLYREGGDLDILVSDEDKDALYEFVDKNPGRIPLDIYTVSGPCSAYRGISYYPPPLALKILKNSIEGPAGSRVPAPQDALLSFLFYCLYYKGLDAGIPTTISGLKETQNPDNNYAETVVAMAHNLNVDLEMDMESLDEYLYKEGWRPKLDTLAKLAIGNEWIKRRFFTDKETWGASLGVFILKEGIVQKGLVDEVVSMLKKEKILLVREKRLNKSQQKNVMEHLRGGNWSEGRSLEEGRAFLPAVALVVMDPLSQHLIGRDKYSDAYNRLRTLKAKTRRLFDGGNIISLIHSTDNTEQAWEYIKICFPEEISAIKKEIGRAHGGHKISLREKIMENAKYHRRRTILRIKDSIINFIIK